MAAFKGQIESRALSGEARFAVEPDGLVCDALFSQVAIAYADMESLRFEDYAAHITARGENYRIFHMGQETEWFFDALKRAFDEKVVAVLQVTGSPSFAGEGMCVLGEGGRPGAGTQALVRVYPDCLCILPFDNKSARRLPFAFLNGMNRGDWELSVSLGTGETCTFSQMGRNLDPLEHAIGKAMHAQLDANRSFIDEACTLCGSLGFSDTANAARLLPEGIAAPLDALPPLLSTELVRKAKASKMGAVFGRLGAIGDAGQQAIGLKALPEEEFQRLCDELLISLGVDKLTPEQEDALRWIVWTALPSADGRHAIVEFAFPNEGAATYVFRMDCRFDGFLTLINRCLEATGLKREVLSAPAGKLSPEMRMLVERTPAVARMRGLFAGKAAHRSAESWEKNVRAILDGNAPARDAEGVPEREAGQRFAGAPGLKFCTQCGTKLAEGVKFCGECGARL